jgi:hypothetical protein
VKRSGRYRKGVVDKMNTVTGYIGKIIDDNIQYVCVTVLNHGAFNVRRGSNEHKICDEAQRYVCVCIITYDNNNVIIAVKPLKKPRTKEQMAEERRKNNEKVTRIYGLRQNRP